jgi:hypothetical protein
MKGEKNNARPQGIRKILKAKKPSADLFSHPLHHHRLWNNTGPRTGAGFHRNPLLKAAYTA